MPYAIVPIGRGFKVMSQDGKVFSRKPLRKKRAEAQRTAIALSEARKTGKNVSTFY